MSSTDPYPTLWLKHEFLSTSFQNIGKRRFFYWFWALFLQLTLCRLHTDWQWLSTASNRIFFPSHTWVIWNWIWDLLYAGHVFFHCAVVSSYGPRSVKWCCMHETLLDWGHLLPAWQQRSFVWREGVKFLIPSRQSLLSKQIAPTICLAGASK